MRSEVYFLVRTLIMVFAKSFSHPPKGKKKKLKIMSYIRTVKINLDLFPPS